MYQGKETGKCSIFVHGNIQELEAFDVKKNKDYQQKIDSHPLMRTEADIQVGIVSILKKKRSIAQISKYGYVFKEKTITAT